MAPPKATSSASSRWGGLLLATSLGGLAGCNAIAGIEQATLDETVGTSSCNEELQASQNRVQACLLRISCDPIGTSFNLSRCVSLGILDSLPGEDCNASANTCQDVEACLGRSFESSDACEGRERGWNCASGEQALYCDDSFAFAVDCAAAGGTCLVPPDPEAPFTLACQPTGTFDCDGLEAGEYRCSGSVRYTCIEGEALGSDCAASALDCIDLGDGGAVCSGLTEACDAPNVVTCNQDALEYCDPTGRLATFDCTTADLECAVDSAVDQPTCLAPGCATAGRCQEGCASDDSAQFCVGGVPFQVSCEDFGFDGCAETLTTSGETSVFCAVSDPATLP